MSKNTNRLTLSPGQNGKTRITEALAATNDSFAKNDDANVGPKIVLRRSRLPSAEKEQERMDKSAQRRLRIAKANTEAQKLQEGLSEEGKKAAQVVADIEKMLDAWYDPTKLSPYKDAQQGPRMQLAAACVQLASYIHPVFKHIPSSAEAMSSLGVAEKIDLFVFNLDAAEIAASSRIDAESGEWDSNANFENKLAGFDETKPQDSNLRAEIAPHLDYRGIKGNLYRIVCDLSDFIVGMEAAVSFLKDKLHLEFESDFEDLVMSQIIRMQLDAKAFSEGHGTNNNKLYKALIATKTKAKKASDEELAAAKRRTVARTRNL